MIIGLISGFIGFFIFFVGHVLLMQFCPIVTRAKNMQAVFFLTFILMVACLYRLGEGVDGRFYWLTHGGPEMAVLWAILTYFGLFILYMPFYYTIVASLSIETTILLAKAPEQSCEIMTLQEKFVAPTLVGRRLETMAANSFLIRQPNGGFMVAMKGKIIAIIFNNIKNFWRLGPGG